MSTLKQKETDDQNKMRAKTEKKETSKATSTKGKGLHIEGVFDEEEKKELTPSGTYKRMPKTHPCGFHRVSIEHMGVKVGMTRILEDINLDITCGQLTILIGKNGAGKSTLIKAILGELVHEGKIEFQDMKDRSVGQLKIGYVPQTLNIEKNTPVSVYDLFAGYCSKVPVFLRKSKRLAEKITERLKMFGAAELIDKRVGDLSGGELQRVLLAIACTPVPNLLILDEPVSGIDRNGRELFYKILNELKTSYDISIILVSHDLDLVARYADRVILMDKKVLANGAPEEVMESKEFREVFGGAAI